MVDCKVWRECSSHLAKKKESLGPLGVACGGEGPPHLVAPEVEGSTAEASPFRLELERPEPWEIVVSFPTKLNGNLSGLWTLQLLNQCISCNICQSGLRHLLQHEEP